jgi:hypothetical protein
LTKKILKRSVKLVSNILSENIFFSIQIRIFRYKLIFHPDQYFPIQMHMMLNKNDFVEGQGTAVFRENHRSSQTEVITIGFVTGHVGSTGST